MDISASLLSLWSGPKSYSRQYRLRLPKLLPLGLLRLSPRSSTIAAAALCALLVPLMSLAQAQSVATMDGQGTPIRLEAPAKRIICLYGAFSELFQAMNAGDRLVARTTADAAIPGLAHLPAVGTHMRPNIELVVGRRPDLVVQLSGRSQAIDAVRALRKHGLSVAVYNPRNFKELFATIRSMGALAGVSAQAEALVMEMARRLDAVGSRLGGFAKRPKVFFEIRARSLLAAGHGGIVDSVIRAAGGENAVDSNKKIVRMGEEGLYGLNPDVYVVQRGPMNRNPLHPSRRPLYAQLRAVREGRVLEVDEHLFSRPGPQVVRAVEALAAFLHPEAMNNKE